MAFKINDECVACGACAGACPIGAIVEGDGKYEITHGESDTVLSVGGLLSYTISFAAAGAVTVASLFGDMTLEVEPISRRVEKNGDTIAVSLCYALTIGGTRTERDVTVTARAI